MQYHRAGRQGACLDIEADVAPAIANHCMFAAILIGDGDQPDAQLRRVDRVRVTPRGGPGLDRQRAGIEIGMPDQPRLGGGDRRILGESEAPRPARRAEVRQRRE